MSDGPSSTSLRSRVELAKGRRRYDDALKAELLVHIRAYKSRGLSNADISRVLGLKQDTISIWLDPKRRAKRLANDRIRKAKLAPTCVICGARTHYSGPKRGNSGYCKDHFKLNPEYHGGVRKKWKDETVLDKIREWNDLYGEPPTSVDWNPFEAKRRGHHLRAERFLKGEWPWFTIVYRYFGSWNNAIELAGLEPRRSGGYKENSARRYERWEEWTGEKEPPKIDTRHKSKPKRKAKTRKRKEVRKIEKSKSGPPAYWTKERILEKFQEWNELYGEPPYANVWNQPCKLDPRTGMRMWPSTPKVVDQFGSWSRAMRAAGFTPRGEKKVLKGEPSPPRREWTDEELIERLRTWADAHGLPPSQADWPRATDEWPSHSQVSRRWGNFNKGVKAAGLTPLPINVTRAAVLQYLPMRKEAG